MLGEKHGLINDFPEHEERIAELIQTNEKFAESNKAYNALDQEVRSLEMSGAPIGDDQMHDLKKKRASLKDTLYQYLVAGQ